MLIPTVPGKFIKHLAFLLKKHTPQGIYVTHAFGNSFFITAPVLSPSEFQEAFYGAGFHYTVSELTAGHPYHAMVGYLPAEFGEGKMQFKDLEQAVEILSRFGLTAQVVKPWKEGYAILLPTFGPAIMSALSLAGYKTEVAAGGGMSIVGYNTPVEPAVS